MRKTTVIAVLSVVTILLLPSYASQAKDYAYESVAGDMMKTRIYTLDNGLKVYLSVNDEKPRIQTYIAVRTGSRNDPAETTGLAHYLEHLMFKGTTHFGTVDPVAEAPLLDAIETCYEQYRLITDVEERKIKYREIDSLSQLAARYNIPNEYDKLMAAIGSEGSNAYTSDDVTCYTENIPANEIENWAKVQSERFTDMVIRGFHTELEAVYEEYNMGLSNDQYKAWYALSAKLFPGHPYGTQTTIGTQEHLKNPSIVNIKNYFRQYYVPGNVAICMSGDLDPDLTIALIDRYFGSWQPGGKIEAPQYAPVKDLTHHADTTVTGNEAAFVMFGWKLDGGASLQADTLEMVSYLLDNGTAGLVDLDVNQQVLCGSAGAFHNMLAEYSTLIMTGTPKEGQSLDDVRDILLAEMDKLKRGDFDDELITAVLNNLKLDYRHALEDNAKRAGMFVNAFVYGCDWQQVVGKFDRMASITKQDIIDFANRHFNDNYAIVYKETGEDTTLVKIEKPQITAIPANRDMQSAFVNDIVNSKPEPIQPRFLDYDTDMTTTVTSKGLPVRYVCDDTNGTFTLSFLYMTGEETDMWLPFAASYIDFLGTESMSAAQRKQQLYKIACDMSVDVGTGTTFITLSGLAENMTEALALAEDYIAGARADDDVYMAYVDYIETMRKEDKTNQLANFNALCLYGAYGEYNTMRNVPDSTALRTCDPKDLVGMIQALNGYEHEVLYCGPMTVGELTDVIDRCHRSADTLSPVPPSRPYMAQPTDGREILIALYPAKNIYMRQYFNENRQWDADNEAKLRLFNEYFGGGMNSIVFQELRESRGLAYSAYAAYIKPSRKGHPEHVITNIISQNDKMLDCINVFGDILDTMPRSDKAFDLAKQSLIKQIQTARVTRYGIISSYLASRHLGIDYDLNKKLYEDLLTLTLDDIVDFERERMAGKQYKYFILGDESELDMDALEKMAPVRRLTTEQIFGY